MATLTIDIWLKIFQLLDIANMLKCKAVCKLWKDIIRIHAKQLRRVKLERLVFNLEKPNQLLGYLDVHSTLPQGQELSLEQIWNPRRPRSRTLEHKEKIYQQIDIFKLHSVLDHMEVKAVIIQNYTHAPLFSLLWHLSGLCLEARHVTFVDCDFLTPSYHQRRNWTQLEGLRRFFRHRRGRIATFKMERCDINSSLVTPQEFLTMLGPLYGPYKRYR